MGVGLRGRNKGTLRGRAGSEDIYNRKWAVYSVLDYFLRPKFLSKATKSNLASWQVINLHVILNIIE